MAEVIHVVTLAHHTRSVNGDHVRTRLRAQSPEVHFGAALYAHHVDLTALGGEARLIVVVEERIQAGAIDKDIRGIQDAQTPSLLAAGIPIT